MTSQARMRTSVLSALAASALATTSLVLTACDPMAAGLDECATCHSGPENVESSFRGLDGTSDPTDPQVGAHAAHLLRDDVAASVTCDACHPVAEAIAGAEHFISGRAEVLLDGLAAVGGLTPKWDHESRTCSQVYCHGAFPMEDPDDEPILSPVWNQPSEQPNDCEMCHAVPPARTRDGLPHPPSPACETCHPTANELLEIIDSARHIDGVIDVEQP